MQIELLKIIKDLKQEYIKKFNNIEYKFEKGTCIENWVGKLQNPFFTSVFEKLKMRQFENIIIFKYLDFEYLFYKNPEISYTQFWNLYNGIYRECRGITIDVEKEEIVTLPYPKFFNINEQEETSEGNILTALKKAKKVEFTDKLDGSLIISRWYNGRDFTTSSSVIDEKDSSIISYAKKILKQENYQLMLSSYPNWTFLFEEISGNDQHTVIYNQESYGLYLTGMRNVDTGELKSYEEIVSIGKNFNVKIPEKYNLTFSEILSEREKFKHSEKEGYVMNIDGWLVKIKCTEYILLHKMLKNNYSKNDIIEAIYKNRIDDIYSTADDTFKQVINETINIINEYCYLVDKEVEKYFLAAPKDKIEFHKYVKTIPSFYSRYVTQKYYNKNISYLIVRDCGKTVQYVKYLEMEQMIDNIKNNILYRR